MEIRPPIKFSLLLYMDALTLTRLEKKLDGNYAACNPQQVLAAAPHETPTVRPPAPYHEIYSS